jgi:hypothetical protein
MPTRPQTEAEREAARKAAEKKSREVETAKDFRAPLRPEKTGRGMLPGETPAQYRKRMQELREAEERAQKKALEDMSEPER